MGRTPKRKLLDIVWQSFFGDDTKQQKQMSVELHQTKKTYAQQKKQSAK